MRIMCLAVPRHVDAIYPVTLGLVMPGVPRTCYCKGIGNVKLLGIQKGSVMKCQLRVAENCSKV